MKRKRLKTKDLFFVALYGVRARKGRATLTSIGIGIGIAAIVAVSGISASGRADRTSDPHRGRTQRCGGPPAGRVGPPGPSAANAARARGKPLAGGDRRCHLRRRAAAALLTPNA